MQQYRVTSIVMSMSEGVGQPGLTVAVCAYPDCHNAVVPDPAARPEKEGFCDDPDHARCGYPG